MRLSILCNSLVGDLQLLDLGLAPYEGSVQAAHSAWPHQSKSAQQAPARDASRLALCLDGHRFRELERTSCRRDRSLADQDLTGCRCLLEPGGDVDGIPSDERAALTGPADHHFAGVDTDAERKPTTEDLREPRLHRQRRMQGALGVVLVGCGSAKGGHDRVPGELLDRPAGTLDLDSHRSVEAVEQHANALGILGARELGRSDQVGEQNGRAFTLTRRRRNVERHGARRTKTCLGRNVRATLRTRGHLQARGVVVRPGGTPDRASGHAATRYTRRPNAYCGSERRIAASTSRTPTSPRADLSGELGLTVWLDLPAAGISWWSRQPGRLAVDAAGSGGGMRGGAPRAARVEPGRHAVIRTDRAACDAQRHCLRRRRVDVRHRRRGG
jgi:hypothetical protein